MKHKIDKVVTNGDNIRNMSNEELADFLWRCDADFPDGKGEFMPDTQAWIHYLSGEIKQ